MTTAATGDIQASDINTEAQLPANTPFSLGVGGRNVAGIPTGPISMSDMRSKRCRLGTLSPVAVSASIIGKQSSLGSVSSTGPSGYTIASLYDDPLSNSFVLTLENRGVFEYPDRFCFNSVQINNHVYYPSLTSLFATGVGETYPYATWVWTGKAGISANVPMVYRIWTNGL